MSNVPSPAPDSRTGAELPEPSNPFLQFVDPQRYRNLCEIAHQRTAAGRFISPLSRGRSLARAWTVEDPDDDGDDEPLA